jgi:hypothetical protein
MTRPISDKVLERFYAKRAQQEQRRKKKRRVITQVRRETGKE